jgi:hypothetical protein
MYKQFVHGSCQAVGIGVPPLFTPNREGIGEQQPEIIVSPRSKFEPTA